MAQTGFTPIQIYSSSTAAAAPLAANLANSTLGSELAINITDGKLFYKDNTNAIQVIAWKVTPTSAGGTGLTSYTAGDMLFYASGTVLSKLAIGASGRYLSSSGTAPQWSAPAALTKTDDTNVTLTLGGSASTALLNAASLAFTAATAAQIVSAIGSTAVTNATNATNTGITDDTTTAAVMYPTWVTSTTGNLPQKVSSSKLTWTPSTGILNIGNASSANSSLSVINSANTGNAARLGLMGIGGSSGGGSYPYIGYNMVFTATSTINYYAGDTAAAIQFGRAGGQIETFTAASGTGAISFTAGPYVAPGGTSWTNSSDERLKDIQGEITGALDMVDQFRAVYHTWKSDANKKRRVSLIAQDLLPVLPEAVNVPPMEFEERSGERLYMGIEYDYVIPVLVAAIKDLRAEFNAYKTAHP